MSRQLFWSVWIAGRDRGGVDGEVDHQLGSEGLDELDGCLDLAVGGSVRDDRDVLDVLGADPDDDPLAGVLAQRWPLGE